MFSLVKHKGLFPDFFSSSMIDIIFRTSCKCSKCEGASCEKFMVRENQKPYKSGDILVHGLTKCKTCLGVWNRDINGATNIYRIAKSAINGIERPKYLCREKKEDVKVEKPKKEKVKKVIKKKSNKSVGVVNQKLL